MMDNDFFIKGSQKILTRLKVNVLYMDGRANPLSTYYDKGATHRHQDAVVGYVLYISYDDALFFRAHCDMNPEYFDYSTKKSVTVERVHDRFYVNVVFLAEQEWQENVHGQTTEMLTLRDAVMKYRDDFHPKAWREQISLEDKFRGTLLP